MTAPSFECLRIKEEPEADGVVRLMLLGELDIAVIDVVHDRIRQAAQSSRAVRVDLSQLRFIDGCGLQAILEWIDSPRRDGWGLTVDPEVSPPVGRLIDLLGVSGLVWPSGCEERAPLDPVIPSSARLRGQRDVGLRSRGSRRRSRRPALAPRTRHNHQSGQTA